MNQILKKIKIGIMSLEEFQERTIRIASGAYKPKRSEPKIWHNYLGGLTNILSPRNLDLLRLIADTKPKLLFDIKLNSVSKLESLSGREADQLLEILREMERYGFLKLASSKPAVSKDERGVKWPRLIPTVICDMANIEINFTRWS